MKTGTITALFFILVITMNTKLLPAQPNYVLYEAGKLEKQDPSYLTALDRWKLYPKTATFPPQINDKEYDILIPKSIFTLLNNRQSATGGLKHEGVYPSYTGFPGFWAWDSWKHAYALAAIEPELAKNCIRSMYDYQDTCGMIADCKMQKSKYGPKPSVTIISTSTSTVTTTIKRTEIVDFGK